MLTHAPTPALSERTPARRSALLATLCGLLIPGGGQWYVGRPGKALVMFGAIGFLYLLGLHLTGYTAVNPLTHRLEFVAHAMALGPTALVTYLTQHVELNRAMPWLEIGRLYVAVAGLLNLVAISDAWGHVLHGNTRAERLTHLLAHRRDRLAAAQRMQPAHDDTTLQGNEPATAFALRDEGPLPIAEEPVVSVDPALPGEPGFVPGEVEDVADEADDGWNLFDHIENERGGRDGAN